MAAIAEGRPLPVFHDLRHGRRHASGRAEILAAVQRIRIFPGAVFPVIHAVNAPAAIPSKFRGDALAPGRLDQGRDVFRRRRFVRGRRRILRCRAQLFPGRRRAGQRLQVKGSGRGDLSGRTVHPGPESRRLIGCVRVIRAGLGIGDNRIGRIVCGNDRPPFRAEIEYMVNRDVIPRNRIDLRKRRPL